MTMGCEGRLNVPTSPVSRTLRPASVSTPYLPSSGTSDTE